MISLVARSQKLENPRYVNTKVCYLVRPFSLSTEVSQRYPQLKHRPLSNLNPVYRQQWCQERDSEMSSKSLMGKSLLRPLWTGKSLILFANTCHILLTNICHINIVGLYSPYMFGQHLPQMFGQYMPLLSWNDLIASVCEELNQTLHGNKSDRRPVSQNGGWSSFYELNFGRSGSATIALPSIQWSLSMWKTLEEKWKRKRIKMFHWLCMELFPPSFLLGN